MNELFVKNPSELADSIIEFNNASPGLMRKTLGRRPTYFVHIKVDGKDYFGLAKFCAFRNTSVKQYLDREDRRHHGASARRHVLKLTKTSWTPETETSVEFKNAFDIWIGSFHKTYNVEKALFISLENLAKPAEASKTIKQRSISPKELLEKLARQERIGKVGEKIALRFETEPLKKMGVSRPQKYLHHKSLVDAAAGYDISNSYPARKRYIEVKASTSKNGDFFITENEVKTLEDLGDSAFIYLVHVTDLDKETGRVYKTIQNPIKILKELDCMQPVAYRISPKNL